MKIMAALSFLGAEYEKMTIFGNSASNSKESICFRYSKYYDTQKVGGLLNILKEWKFRIDLTLHYNFSWIRSKFL